MNSTRPQTAPPAPEPASQPARRRVTDYDRLVDDLAYTYEGIFSRDSIVKADAHARANRSNESATSARRPSGSHHRPAT